MRSSRSANTRSAAKSRTQSAARAKKRKESSEVESPVLRQSARNKKSPPTSAKAKRSQSQAHGHEVVYEKGSYVAFIDPGYSLENFKVGLLLEDLKQEDDEVLMDVYIGIAPLQFQKQAAKQPVLEYTIICDVNVTEDKVVKKKGAKPSVSMTKQQFNKVSKHLDIAVARIEEEGGKSEDDDEDDEEEEESDEEEEEEDSDDETLKKDSGKEIQKRRMVKGGKSSRAASQSQRSRSTVKTKKSQGPAKKQTSSAVKKQASQKIESKKSPLKSRAQSKKPKEEDDDMDEDESETVKEESEIEMIDTSKKAAAKKRKPSKKSQEQMPKVGEKRLRVSKKKTQEDESEEPSKIEHSGDGSFDEDDEHPVKKRKVAGGKAQAEKKPKAKKAPKRPTEFKKGRWNPDIQLIDMDKYKESPSAELFLDCCIRCNNKNIIRAAVTGNEKLLKAGIAAKTKISSLTAYWSPEVKWTSLEYMVSKNEHQLLEILLHPQVKVPAHSTYEQERNSFFSQRSPNPKYLMDFVDSGMVSHMAYGARVRKVQMTRGNRQGNNAFLEYIDNPSANPVYYVQDEFFLKRMMYTQTVTSETFKQIFKLNPAIESYLQNYAYEAVRAGNREIALDLIKTMVKYPNFGFNNLHADVLSEDAVIEKVLKASVTKKAQTNKDVTPLHCACINPNPKYLKQLLEAGPDLETVDADLRRPVHYAAACVGPEPLQILLASGATISAVDNQKVNCLHIAAMTGREENVRTILQANAGLINTKDKKGMNAMAYACKFGKTEVVKVLLEFKARVNAGCGLIRMTPLCWAAAYGHFELCEFLINNKGRVLGKDKYKRTPLILACRNGHAKIASLLLQFGSEWNHNDSSMNTPLHYTAAYGWLDIMDMLLKAGADVNAQNSWKISPINIAMLKNHHGCVKRLLEEPNVDVNGKDEKGRTLIMLSLVVIDDETFEFVSYLLRKGADPNIADLEGQTSLHYIAKYVPRGTDAVGKSSKAEYLKQIEIQKKITLLLIQNNADLTIKDSYKRTAFSICLDNDNAPLLEFLQDKVSINKEPELFFSFKNKIFNVEYQKILMKLIHNDPPTQETINTLDETGMTPFLSYIQSFTANHPSIFNNIQNRVNQQSFLHGLDKKKYVITNHDIFDKFANQENYYNYNYNFPQETKNELTHEILDKIIVKPFIEILQFLISKGANPHALVGKLKKYRDLEELKKQQLAALAEGREIKIEKEEVVKKRDEKLEELRERKAKKFGGRIVKTAAPSFLMNSIQNNSTTQDVYEKIGGKKVLREYGSNGLMNAIHLLIGLPQQSLFVFLLSLKINPDQPDYDEITPFNLLSKQGVNTGDKIKRDAFDKLLDLNVRIDYPDRKGRTPFLNFYDAQNTPLAYQMLDMGANVNQMDTSGLFALKYALIRRNNNAIQELLDRGANINQIDNKGRNLLHHAINMSSATADATFETEQFLIERGVDINLKDQKLRTPLHYAFVKIQDWSNCTQIDPIETVSSLCGCKGLELDVPDKWQKTPLHYASQRGASICAMYMIARGANVESKDIYGNTPLGVGLMNRHYNYGIILIQKNASVHPLTFQEDSERIKKQWEEEEKAKRALYKIQKKGSKAKLADDDVDMAEEDEEEEKSKAKVAKHKARGHQNMFQGGIKHLDYGYDDEYDEEEEYDDEDDDYQENVFNQQNAFGINVYQTRAQKKASRYNNGWNGGGVMFGQQQPAAQMNLQGQSLITSSDKEGVSMFKLAIRGGQQGLAYLMLDNGYDLMLAMQDAMDEKKFMLVLTLLSKNPDDSVIQRMNSKGQNLFHILSMNAKSCSFDHLKRIYDALMKRGVNCKAKDTFGRTALHYAVISQSQELVNLLLTSADGYDPNEVDKEGHSPLSLCLEGDKSSNQFYNPVFMIQNIFLLLVKSGADVNFVYPDKSYKPAFKEEELDEEYMDSYDPKGKYYCTPLINLIRLNLKNEVLRNNLIGLIEYGAKLDVVDSDGRDPIMYAIMCDNEMCIKILLENKKALNARSQGRDKSGKSAAHYVVNPVKFGSYENLEILRLIHKYGFNLQLKDSSRKTPVEYAALQESGVLLKEFAKLLGRQQQLEQIGRALSMVDTQHWPESKVDFEADAELYMDLAHEREAKIAKEKDQKVPVDSTGKFEKSYSVYYDEQDHPWDVYLTKVDLKNGIYGDYVFYKMQLLYDSNRDLYVVFTRWGRIGETGMNQRTPFNNLEEAKTEYKKIFKQKTGGNNFEELDKFSRVKKKYNLTRVNYITVNFKDYLQPFDYDKCPKSRLGQDTYDLFQEISNVTMYQRAITEFGIDTNVLPFSGVKKESIIEARQILNEIQECLKEDIELAKEGIRADFDKLQAVKEKVSELSSRYYELIPSERFKNQIAPPLNNQHLIKQQFETLEGLANIEYASRILLGALYKQKEINPVDYVYNALNLLIEPLEKEGPEFDVISTYIENTRNQAGNFYNYNDQYGIANIFKIQRKGEAEMIQAFKEVPNHFLLFHGSMMFNYIGILSQGLRIAPPEAPTTGYMFGKGVYFADMFDKSFPYAARGYQQQDSFIMLLCEVVLGKQKELYNAEYVEKLEAPYHSVKGCGRRGPGYKHTLVLPNGVKIPYGKVIDYFENNQEKLRQMVLQHNEYIVYNTAQIRMRYLVQVQKKELLEKKLNKQK